MIYIVVKVTKVVGLKCWNFEGLLSLGMRAICVSVISLSKYPLKEGLDKFDRIQPNYWPIDFVKYISHAIRTMIRY
jgi:hypothetical protein